MSLPFLAMPSSLPAWQVGGYALEEATLYAHAPMSTGHSRTRRLYSAAETTHTATLRVNADQLRDFHDWFEGDLQAGLLPFAVLLADPLQGTAWYEAQFVGSEAYTSTPQPNGMSLLACKIIARGQGQQAGPADMIADFAIVLPWPALGSKLGMAQNLKDDTLVNTVPYMVELGITGFFGNLELDGWFKNGANVIPWCNCTYDGAGRAVTMTGVPTAVATTMISTLNAAGIWPGVQITGATAAYQPATTGTKRRHPAPTNIGADGAIVAQYTDQSWWGGVGINFSHWNEPLRTMFDCAKGFDIDNTPITETQAQYETRRKVLKLQAVNATRDIYLARASTATYNIGADSTWSWASILAGDTRTSNGRTVPDGRTGREALFDVYDSDVKTVSSVVKISYVTCNDFASRGGVITGSNSDFNGGDYPIIYTQGGPALFKTSLDDDGGDDQDPAPDTRMGPALQMATMMVNEWENPAVALRHWSYFVGGQDAMLSADGMGGYIKRHRFTAIKMLTTVPTRRVMLSAVKASPSGDADAYGQQGLIGVAGIDPGGQAAAVLVWNETTTDKTVTLQARNLPAALRAAGAQRMWLDEAHPAGTSTGWAGEPITLAPRTMHLITWSVGTSLQLRRQPLESPSRTPRFLRRVDTYKRPKGACAYFDQVRGVGWLCPASASSSKISTGAAWDNAPDAVWLNLYTHNVTQPGASFTVTAKYGTSGSSVTLLSTTVGAVDQGTPVQINLLASAPGGWSAGTRKVELLVNTQGASDQRIECWFSGTLAKAQTVAGA